MDILRDISQARLKYREHHGLFPNCLVACPRTVKKIKTGLYQGLSVNPEDIPLQRYDGMVIKLNREL